VGCSPVSSFETDGILSRSLLVEELFLLHLLLEVVVRSQPRRKRRKRRRKSRSVSGSVIAESAFLINQTGGIRRGYGLRIVRLESIRLYYCSVTSNIFSSLMRKKENYDLLLITSIAGGEVDQNDHVYSTPAGGPLNWTPALQWIFISLPHRTYVFSRLYLSLHEGP
jgi:hypothetical protein